MRKLDPAKALVLFSGGQDSAIALAWALERYEHVATIGFDYGQRHSIELGARQKVRRALTEAFSDWAGRLDDDALIHADALSDVSETALTDAVAIGMAEDGLPTTFVPGRNLVFLTLAAAQAYRTGAGVLVGGMCETDYSGYPDCRQKTLDAQMQAIRLGMEADITLETPLMRLSKADSWRLAEELGGKALVDLVNEHTHSCYEGVRAAKHDWGYGCGACPACDLRKAGWRDYVGGENATD